jgi:transposase
VNVPQRVWSKRGLAWLGSMDLATEMDAIQRDVLVERLHSLAVLIDRVDRALSARSKGKPGVQLLKTIPGVGDRTAEAVVAWIDDPRRFSRIRSAGRYFGLVPSQDASASFNRMGHITRGGPGTIRWLLTEAAWQAIRRSRRVRDFYERVRRGDPERTKVALVATAHYLLRVMVSMLQTGEVWRSEKATV